MKNIKFIVDILDSDGNEKSKTEYKSFKEIAEALSLDYHIVRELNRMTESKIIKKFTHDNIKHLYKYIKIYNIKPEIK